MQINLYTNSFPPKRFIGSELYDLELAKYLISEGHKVSVFTAKHGDSWSIEGVEVNPKKQKADVVFTHLEQTLDAVTDMIASKAKLIGIGHSFHEQSLITGRNMKFDGLILNSENMKAEFGKIKTENTLIITPPVPEPRKRFAKERKDITSVNQGVAKGGRVFAELAKELPNEKFRAVLGGWGNQHKVDLPNIEYMDHANDVVKKALGTSKVFILASITETWSMAGCEALSNGVPVVYHEHLSGVREMAGEAGVAVPMGDMEALVKAVTSELPDRETCLKQAKANKARHEKGLAQLIDFIGGL